MTPDKFSLAHIDAMEGHEFEYFVADLLRKAGYQKVEVTPGSGDQGVDVLAERDGVRFAIQCKCYSSDLGNTPVQEVNAGKAIYHCHVGVVVTNRYFSQSAHEAAAATGVLLWDRSWLEKMISQLKMDEADPASTSQKKKNASTSASTSKKKKASVSKVEAPPSLWTGSPLLRRGKIALGDKEWKKASQFFDRVLNSDPENGEAYLGLVMAKMELSDAVEFELAYTKQAELVYIAGQKILLVEEVASTITETSPGYLRIGFQDIQIRQDKNFLHAKEFANPELSAWFEYLEAKRIQEEAQKKAKEKEAEQARKKAEMERKQKEKAEAAERKQREKAEAAERKQREKAEAAERKQREKAEQLEKKKTAKKYIKWNRMAAPLIYASKNCTIGWAVDGTVMVAGECTLLDQVDIKNIAAFTEIWKHVIWLQMDGKVVGMESDSENHVTADRTGGISELFRSVQVDEISLLVSKWKNIVDIAVGSFHVVGLRIDGTVVATSSLNYRSSNCCNVQDWRDVIAIAAGPKHTVGLRIDRTVVAVGSDEDGQCHVSGWKNIVAIAAGGNTGVGKHGFTIGLQSTGTVITAGISLRDHEWENIIAIAAGSGHIVGLRSDGTVIAEGESSSRACDVSNWTNVIAIAAGDRYTVGLRADGTVLVTGHAPYDTNNVSKWKLFHSIETLEKERKEARTAKKAPLMQERSSLQEEMATLKGLFGGKRRREIEKRLAEIESELSALNTVKGKAVSE